MAQLMNPIKASYRLIMPNQQLLNPKNQKTKITLTILSHNSRSNICFTDQLHPQNCQPSPKEWSTNNPKPTNCNFRMKDSIQADQKAQLYKEHRSTMILFRLSKPANSKERAKKARRVPRRLFVVRNSGL